MLYTQHSAAILPAVEPLVDSTDADHTTTDTATDTTTEIYTTQTRDIPNSRQYNRVEHHDRACYPPTLVEYNCRRTRPRGSLKQTRRKYIHDMGVPTQTVIDRVESGVFRIQNTGNIFDASIRLYATIE